MIDTPSNKDTTPRLYFQCSIALKKAFLSFVFNYLFSHGYMINILPPVMITLMRQIDLFENY